jgi:hypothetical protein
VYFLLPIKSGETCKGLKTTATNGGARVHPALLQPIATVSGNGALKASTLPIPIWGIGNELARAAS